MKGTVTRWLAWGLAILALVVPLTPLIPEFWVTLLILIGLLIVLPLLGAQLGVDLSVVSHVLAVSTRAIIEAILHVTGNIYSSALSPVLIR